MLAPPDAFCQEHHRGTGTGRLSPQEAVRRNVGHKFLACDWSRRQRLRSSNPYAVLQLSSNPSGECKSAVVRDCNAQIFRCETH